MAILILPGQQSDISYGYQDLTDYPANGTGYSYGNTGGGGGMVGILAFGYIIDSQGKLTQEARAIAENAEAYLLLPAGTYCLLDGYPISFIYIRPPYSTEPTPTDPEFGEYATRYFVLGPDGSTFDPPITLIFNYKESLIPEGYDEEDLSIYTWDEELGEWEKLTSQLDPENNTISCYINHFSGFAVIAAPEYEPEPEPTPEPTQEPNPEPGADSTIVPPTTAPFDINEGKGMNQGVLAVIVFGVAVVIIGVAVYLIRYKRILD
jgi:hypothetical protein